MDHEQRVRMGSGWSAVCLFAYRTTDVPHWEHIEIVHVSRWAVTVCIHATIDTTVCHAHTRIWWPKRKHYDGNLGARNKVLPHNLSSSKRKHGCCAKSYRNAHTVCREDRCRCSATAQKINNTSASSSASSVCDVNWISMHHWCIINITTGECIIPSIYLSDLRQSNFVVLKNDMPFWLGRCAISTQYRIQNALNNFMHARFSDENLQRIALTGTMWSKTIQFNSNFKDVTRRVACRSFRLLELELLRSYIDGHVVIMGWA